VETAVLEMGLDLIVYYISGILVSTFGADRSNNHHEIGHVIEMTTAFCVLVTGEILIIVSYIATKSEIGDAPWV